MHYEYLPTYDYPDKELWETPICIGPGEYEEGPKRNMRLRFLEMGDDAFDVDRLINSEMGEKTIALMKHYILNWDPMGEGVLEYWRSLGLKKEWHDEGTLHSKFAIYTPLEMEQNPGKTYPLLYVMHGSDSDCYNLETTGYVQAAGAEAISVIPKCADTDNLVAIYHYMTEHYPIDKSRVYLTSYCGGNRSNWFSHHYPELIAAIGPCGNPVREDWKPTMTPEQYEHFKKFQMPLIHIEGMNDLTQLFPLNIGGDDVRSQRSQHWRRVGMLPLQTIDAKIEHLRDRLYLSNCRDVTPEEVACTHLSPDRVVRLTGLPADRTETVPMYGFDHYIAYFTDCHGDEIVRFVGTENMPHTPVASTGELVWAYVRQFRRNQTTYAIERVEEA